MTDVEGSTKINLLAGPVATESLTFSFDKAGVIDDLLFDGITDDALEFFRLESTGGYLATFFDFEIPAIVDVGLMHRAEHRVHVHGRRLQRRPLRHQHPVSGGRGVHALVRPGQRAGAAGAALGNGGRFGGVNVHAVPEPEQCRANTLHSRCNLPGVTTQDVATASTEIRLTNRLPGRSLSRSARCRGRRQTGGQAGTGAAQTAGAAGRKQLPQQPQPVALAASAATASSIKNLFMFVSPYCPLVVNGERQVTRFRGDPPRRFRRHNSYASRAQEFATQPYPLADDVQTQRLTFCIISL